MNYVGIDLHKKYSVLCAQDEVWRKLKEARIEGACAEGYARFFRALGVAEQSGLGSVLELGLDP